jgi:hypothetical protein
MTKAAEEQGWRGRPGTSEGAEGRGWGCAYSFRPCLRSRSAAEGWDLGGCQPMRETLCPWFSCRP